MDRHNYEWNAAGRPVRFRLRDPEAARWFAVPLTPCGGAQSDVWLRDADLAYGRTYFAEDVPESFIEYRLLCLPAGRYLLGQDACLFHAVSFIWQGLAWLVSAYSGVGKSTQFCNWWQLTRGGVEIISGDHTTLSLEADGSVLVSPSPWPGKERWYGSGSAPLGGVIFLEQSEKNEILRLPPDESIPWMTGGSICRPDTEEEIRRFAALLDRILSDHPVWLLRNRGDADSTRLSMQAITSYLTERNGP